MLNMISMASVKTTDLIIKLHPTKYVSITFTYIFIMFLIQHYFLHFVNYLQTQQCHCQPRLECRDCL